MLDGAVCGQLWLDQNQACVDDEERQKNQAQWSEPASGGAVY
jgi:hypothetical protein